MALKVLLLRKKLTDKQDELRGLEAAAEAFKTREVELETSIEEVQTEEERSVVEEAVAAFEAERDANTQAQEALRSEIDQMGAEMRTLEEQAREAVKHQGRTEPEARKDDIPMNTRTRFFGMTVAQRDAFFSREDMKDFLQRVREMAQEKRSVTGAELLIPEIALELLRENIGEYSKLSKYVNLRRVNGKARQNIMGTIPEAVWTEMCAKLNELELGFSNVEVDGFKVGGFFAECNATLEDSDPALGQEILTALAAAIGYALDKAILYGTGTKMPLGIVTRLAQAEQPSSYPSTARPWANLSTSNIQTITAANSTGVKLFQNLLKGFGAAKSRYSRGVKFWVMNEATYTVLMAEALSINASGAIVSGMQSTMPVIGGDIVLLDFVPDNNIIAGFGDLYLLAERAGMTLATSEHVRFVEDQTVFKGTARYDGKPVIAEAFVVFGLSGTTPTTTMTFAADTANAG